MELFLVMRSAKQTPTLESMVCQEISSLHVNLGLHQLNLMQRF